MTEHPESELHNNDPVERLENALVRMAFILEQRDSYIAEEKKRKEAELARVTAQIDALESRITTILQGTAAVEEKKG